MKETTVTTKWTCDKCGATVTTDGEQKPETWCSMTTNDTNGGIEVSAHSCGDCELPVTEVLERFKAEVAAHEAEAAAREAAKEEAASPAPEPTGETK